jgi:hypothetical protein
MNKDTRKAGGCSSTSYAGVSDNYMLMENALVKAGGRKSKGCRARRGGDPAMKDIFGGAFGDFDLPHTNDMRRGGDPMKDMRRGGDPMKDMRRGGDPMKDMRRGGDPKNDMRRGGTRDSDMRRRGGNDVQAPATSLGFGSAMKGFTDTIASMSGKESAGGCGFASCSKKAARRTGGTIGLEVAPFISSLVILGLRAANDKALQAGITKKLGSLVSGKTKTKSRSLFD